MLSECSYPCPAAQHEAPGTPLIRAALARNKNFNEYTNFPCFEGSSPPPPPPLSPMNTTLSAEGSKGRRWSPMRSARRELRCGRVPEASCLFKIHEFPLLQSCRAWKHCPPFSSPEQCSAGSSPATRCYRGSSCCSASDFELNLFSSIFPSFPKHNPWETFISHPEGSNHVM